jgi:hypothetical protein
LYIGKYIGIIGYYWIADPFCMIDDDDDDDDRNNMNISCVSRI